MSKNNIGKIAIIALVALVSLFVYLNLRSVAYGNGVSVDLCVVEDEEALIAVSDGMVLEQRFVSKVDVLRSVMVRFDYEGALTGGDVVINLIDTQKDEVIRTAAVNYVYIPNDDYTLFDLGELVTGVKDKELKLQVVMDGIPEGELFIRGLQEGNQILYDSKYVTAGRDSFCSLINAVYIITILALLAVLGMALFGKSFKVENAYLILALSLGLVMTLIMPVMVAPDETTHSYIAYEMANDIMGVDQGENGALIMRRDDASRAFQSMKLDREYYNQYYDDFFDGVQDESLVETNIYPASAPFYLYIFSAFGMIIGRLLNMGTIMVFMLGRWFNMLAFGLITFYAIKRIPFGKTVLAVWALLPIMLQQVGSYSYDCGINALSVLVIGLTMNFMYGKKDMPKYKRIIDIVLLVLACLMLVPCKGHAIIPMALLPVMLIVKLLWDRRDKIKAFFNEKPVRKVIFVVAIIVIALMVVLVGVVVLKRLLATADGNGDYLEYLDQYAHPIGYYLKNPKALVLIFINTVWSIGDEYIKQMLGAILGWLEVPVPLMFIIPFLFLFVFAGMRREDEEQPIGVLSKLWMWVVFLGVCFLACLGMLLYWTPMYFTTIAGVQGRYFLPGLALVGLTIRTKNSALSKNADRIIMSVIPLLYVFIFTSILMFRMN